MLLIERNLEAVNRVKETLDLSFFDRIIVLEDDGFLPDSVESLMLLAGGSDSSLEKSPLYHNHLSLPDFWEVGIHEGVRGKASFWGKKKAILDFANPKEKRYISHITWLTDDEKPLFWENYSQYGKVFFKTYHPETPHAVRIYYDNQEKEFAQTVPGKEGIIVSNTEKLDGYYPNRLAFLIAVLQAQGESRQLVTSDIDLLSDDDNNLAFLNRQEHQQINDLPELSNRLVIDVTEHSQRRKSLYQKVMTQAVGPKEKKSLFVLTASDQLEGLSYLVEHLPEYHLSIGARTTVSPTLQDLERYANVTVLSGLSNTDVKSLLQKSSFYLDINHHREVDEIVSRAVMARLCLLSFRPIAHRFEYYHEETLFEENDVEAMVAKVKQLDRDETLREEVLDYQMAQLDFQVVDSAELFGSDWREYDAV
ncbi:hypothetical protein [Streptococcus thoraltensis]|uniref:hypothetical protein n=1 Tax=Streptococcus thoraltensis TaxID=55085 RepID=UPI00037DE48F|nr:hypothetical protein [Streptococcus thoraltensis]MDY4761075.1 hypothetical protein [Streptococcus thoraltensis]